VSLLSVNTFGNLAAWNEWAEEHGIDSERVEKIIIIRNPDIIRVMYDKRIHDNPLMSGWVEIPLLSNPPGVQVDGIFNREDYR
jgi:hypothetical protein